MNKRYNIKDIELKLTCEACPEAYEAFMNGKQIGYLKLRYGNFTVEYPREGGKVIYRGYPQGDGEFEENERELHLNIAKRKLIEEHKKRYPNDK